MSRTGGQLVGVAPPVLPGIEADQLQQLVDPAPDALPVPPEQPGDGGHVVGHGQVREQADVLDDVADAPAQLDGVGRRDIVALQEDAPARRFDQAVDHLQRGGLPAPRRADQHADLAGPDLQVQGVHGDLAVVPALGERLQPDQGA
jgi:hypothetical protein